MNHPWHELVPPKFRAILRSLITLSPHHLAAEIPLQRQIISSRLFAHWKTTNTRHVWSPTANQPNLSDAFCDLETRQQNPCNRFTFHIPAFLRRGFYDDPLIIYIFFFLMLHMSGVHSKYTRILSARNLKVGNLQLHPLFLTSIFTRHKLSHQTTGQSQSAILIFT